jgi:small-conductance mechanosensitive channel
VRVTILDSIFLTNSPRQWALALVVALGTFLVLTVVLRIIRGRVAKFAERTTTAWDDVFFHALGRTHRLFIPILSLSAGLGALEVPARFRNVVEIVAVLSLLLQLGIWVSAGFGGWLQRYTARELTGDAAAATTMAAMAFAIRLVLWTVILLVALDNLGVNITALVAGLGVGGIAIALATQNILGDLFASLSIVLDKPFVLGDFVMVDEHMGNVEHIGLKTTRIRSLSGEQLVFSNSDLLGSRLRNFGRMAHRRVVFPLGVTYQTPRHKLSLIPDIVRAAIEEQDKTRFDRSHFKEFGDFSLNFESVYYVLSREFNDYMDIQQAVNLRVHERFEAEGIEFAYPTQTLFVAASSST